MKGNPARQADEAIRWLLEGDPAIRWQTLSDLIGARDRRVTFERSTRKATSAWSRPSRLYGAANARTAAGRWRTAIRARLTLHWNGSARPAAGTLYGRSVYCDGGSRPHATPARPPNKGAAPNTGERREFPIRTPPAARVGELVEGLFRAFDQPEGGTE